MLLVLPVTRADSKLAKPLLSLMAKLGGIRPHKLVLAFTKTIPEVERKEIEAEAAPCGDVTSITLATTDERGWPRSANSVFSECARTVFQNNGWNEPCWYFFEADNTPMCRDWLAQLQAEYNLAKMPCMGVVNRTMRGIGTANRHQDGTHLVGTSIYPTDLWKSVKLCKHINLLTDPFDVAIQWEVVPKSHNTELIQHNWNSLRYKRSGVRISCQSTGNYDSTEYAQPVRAKAVVVHGCKDGSLIKLVEERL